MVSTKDFYVDTMTSEKVVRRRRVYFRDRCIVLLEIEPRPRGSMYCMVAFEQDQEFLPWLVTHALDAVRAHEGVFDDADLPSAFETMTSNPVVSLKHFYAYEGEGGKRGAATGLLADRLANALARVPHSSSGLAMQQAPIEAV